MHSEAVTIYNPTTDEWPYVVLLRRDDAYDAFVASTHEEARTIAIAKRQGLEIEQRQAANPSRAAAANPRERSHGPEETNATLSRKSESLDRQQSHFAPVYTQYQ
jgi:hypothetical protein